jgi:uncharacterized membrane protein YhhN
VLWFAALTALALAVLLVADARGARTLRWIAKPLASAGFVGAALAAGALESAYGTAVAVALALCWLGDVLLIPRAEGAFRAGLASFLLGHLALVAAFALRGLHVAAMAAAAAGVAVVAIGVMRWLRPHLSAALRAPVLAYVGTISAMVVFAAGAARAGGALIPLGALLFFVSDLAVARERFVAPGFANKAWGLPLYYAATLVLAATVRGA